MLIDRRWAILAQVIESWAAWGAQRYGLEANGFRLKEQASSSRNKSYAIEWNIYS